MSRKSLIIGSTILLAWLFTMGLLLKNYYYNRQTVPAFSSKDFFQSVKVADRWQNIDEYMLLLRGESIIGASKTSIRKLESNTDSNPAQYLGTFALTGAISELLPKANVKVTTYLDADMNLTEFLATFGFGDTRFSAQGKALDKLLYLIIDKPNGTSIKKLQLDKPITLAEIAKSSIGAKMEIEPGNSITLPVVNPLSGSISGSLRVTVKDKESITYQGKPQSAYKIVSDYNDIQNNMWVTKDGTTIKRQLFGNITMEKSTSETAHQHAPNLDQHIEIPEMDMSQFDSIPTINPNDKNQSGSSPELKLLETLLN